MATVPQRRKSRLLTAAVVTCVALTAMAIFHRPLLRCMALPLVHQRIPAELDYLVLQDRTERDPEVYDLAVDWLRVHPQTQVVLLHHGRSRVRQSGAVPTFEQVCRAELSRRGLENADLAIVSYESNSAGNRIATLEGWLGEHPGRAMLVCGRFDGRLTWAMLNQKRSDGKVGVAGLPLKAIDENNWWHSATGIKGVMIGYIDYFHFLWKGRCDEPGAAWNPVEYEQWLKKQQDGPVGAAA